MRKSLAIANRRDFLKFSGLASAAAIAPFTLSKGSSLFTNPAEENKDIGPAVHFSGDRLDISAPYFLRQMTGINAAHPIEADIYGRGGATQLLLDRFAELTGKEKAIFFPTGTMANEVAIKMLCGNNTKVMVPENSHVYRDEADAAVAVHGKRLVPVGKGKPYYDLDDLIETLVYYDQGEVFKSGLGTVMVECPVRRADGVAVPLETIRKISGYCREKGYPMHLDGARLLIASAFTGVPVAEYSTYFDTVYISLYKYLNAPFGAVLCGDAELIDKMEHQIKILGGATFQTWIASAPALYFLDGFMDRWENVVDTSRKLFSELNALDGIAITDIPDGTNIFNLKFSEGADPLHFAEILYKEHNILLRRPDEEGTIKLYVNESLLLADTSSLVDAWARSFESCKSGR